MPLPFEKADNEKGGENELYALFATLLKKKQIRDPKKLAAWLRAKAEELGEESSEHTEGM